MDLKARAYYKLKSALAPAQNDKYLCFSPFIFIHIDRMYVQKGKPLSDYMDTQDGLCPPRLNMPQIIYSDVQNYMFLSLKLIYWR